MNYSYMEEKKENENEKYAIKRKTIANVRCLPKPFLLFKQVCLSCVFAYKDLKNILSNANLLVVLPITLSTKVKKITPKKLRFCDLFTITRLLM